MTYVPLTYLQDMEALLRTLELERFVLFGTSLGGLITMLLAPRSAAACAGALINDIGPVLDEPGLARIRTYVGRSQAGRPGSTPPATCATCTRSRFPDWGWRIGSPSPSGWPSSAIRAGSCSITTCASPSRSGSPRRWRAWTCGAPGARLQEVPTLIVRGETSDILSPARSRGCRRSIGPGGGDRPRTGHAPTLDEPEARRRSPAARPRRGAAGRLPDRPSASSTPIPPSRWAARKRARCG
jgi:pimeloyl-ACP methyl ester carboxylesterase